MKHLVNVLVAAAAFGSQAAAAQAGDAVGSALAKLSGKSADVEVGEFLKSLTADMPVATPPATFVLGAAGTTVPRVATFREFVTQIGSAVGDDGKINRSVAVEINPRLALGPVQWSDFKASRLTQVLTRTTVSAATLAEESQTGAKSAIGLQSVLYSAQVGQLITAASSGPCAAVADDFLKSQEKPNALVPGKPVFPLPEAAQENARKCKASVDALLTKWNPTSLTVGLGQALYSADGSPRKLKSASGGLWMTATLGYDFKGADPDEPADRKMGLGATLHLRRMVHDRVADPADPSVKLDERSTLLGLNVRGGNGRLGGLAEFSVRRGSVETLSGETRKRRFAGLEYRVAEGLYVVVGVGSDKGRRDGKDQRVTLANLKWGFSGGPVLIP